MVNGGTSGCSGLKSGKSACELRASGRRPPCKPHSFCELSRAAWQIHNALAPCQCGVACFILSASTSAMPA